MPTGRPIPLSLTRRLAELIVVALVTILAMQVSQIRGLLGSDEISAIWPVSAVNIVMMFLRGPRVWPGIALGTLASHTLRFGADHFLGALLTTIPNTLEPLVAIGLYRLTRGGDHPFTRTSDTLRVILCWGVAAPAVSALIGVPIFGRFLAPVAEPFWLACLHWAIPNSVGVLVITPPILCCRRSTKLPWTNAGLLHAGAIITVAAVLEICVFGIPNSGGRFDTHLLIFLLLPLIVWATLIFGARGGALTTLVTSTIVVVGAVRGVGPFAMLPIERSLLILHVYLAAFAVVSLMLGAVTEERAEAYRATVKQAQTIQLLFEELNHRVRNNLASLLSLIDLSRGASRDIDRFAGLIAGRVRAMAEIHSALASGKRVSMTLHELISSIAPSDAVRRIHCEGPDVHVPPKQAMPLGLVFHELVINSLKYGALASTDGQVILKWTSARGPDGLRLAFEWHELLSSRVSPPPHNSHTVGNHNHNHNGEAAQRSGLELIAGLIAADLRGQVTFSFPPEGAQHKFQVLISSADSPL